VSGVRLEMDPVLPADFGFEGQKSDRVVDVKDALSDTIDEKHRFRTAGCGADVNRLAVKLCRNSNGSAEPSRKPVISPAVARRYCLPRKLLVGRRGSEMVASLRKLHLESGNRKETKGGIGGL